MEIQKLKKIVAKLPPKPGVYFFKDHKGNNIYVGKASSLKSRVLNYTLALSQPNGKTKDQRIRKMVEVAKFLKFITTDSEIEALILESQYIKKHRPMFNIVMRDDKQYFYVGFSKDKFSRIFLTHQPFAFQKANVLSQSKDYKNYIGPFTDGSALKTTLRYLRNIFPYCTCKQLHNNYCLNYHIGKCPGFCCLKDSPERNRGIADKKSEYSKNIRAMRDVLSGKRVSLIKKLKREMENQAQAENFEQAIKIRLKLERLEKIFENVRVIKNIESTDQALGGLKYGLGLSKVPYRIEAYDISNIQGLNATGSMAVFENGKPNKNEYRKFKIRTVRKANDVSMLQEILNRRFNHPEWSYPDLIIIDGGKGQLNATRKLVPHNISVIALTKNEKHTGVKITLPNKKEIPLSTLPNSVKNLILYIDTEAHRFAINYYRKLHRQKITTY